MASLPPSRELELVLQRFFSLTAREQLNAYRAIRDYLAERVRETKGDRVVAEKDAALRAVAEVAAHLSLPDGKAPTPAQFDAAARALGLGWDRNRVRRAWGRWRFAKAAFVGQQLPDSARQRDERRRRGGRWHTREGYLTGVKLWLATNPEAVSPMSYRDWAREYNENLAPDDLPVVITASNISSKLKVTWGDVVRLARGEITESEARPLQARRSDQFCLGPHELIAFQGVRAILGKSSRRSIVETARADFPAPVVVLSDSRIWQRDDVEAYKGGRRWTPEENARQRDSLRDLYMTLDEVKEATGLSSDQVEVGRDGMPPAVARVGSRVLWLRSEVESSPAVRRSQSPR